MLKIFSFILLVLFIVSGVPLQSFQQPATEVVKLRQVVQQVQIFSQHTDSDNFSDVFRTTVFTLQAVVGLKTIIVNKTDNPNDVSLVIVCINIPYLVPSTLFLSKDISNYRLHNFDFSISNTSFFPSIETPPHIV